MNKQADVQTDMRDPVDADSTTVYFDGSCPLCTVEIAHYKKQAQDADISFVDVSAQNDLGADLTQDAAMKRFHVRLPDGSLVSGARGFVAVWEALPKWRWAARLAHIPGVPFVLEIGYRLFLPIRPVLSGLARRLGARPLNERP